MPSAFAHACFGSALAATFPPGRERAAVALALALLAAAPDLDVIAFRFDIPYEAPFGHRGVSHSLAFALLAGAATLPLWKRVLPARAGLAALLSTCAIASHGLLDAFTDAGLGIGLLLPFDDTRYFAPWRPIRTSPLSVSAFFTGSGLRVLANEAVWVGAPSFALAALLAMRRRRRADVAG